MSTPTRSVLLFLILLTALPSCNGSRTSPGKEIRPVPFQENERWGYKDPGGTVLIPPRYIIAGAFSPEGIAAVADERGWMYIDTRGGVRIRPLLVDNGPDPFREGLARFRRDRRVGFFNKAGTVVIPAAFDFALPFQDGRAAVCRGCREVPDGEHHVLQGGTWGYIDRRGRAVIPFRYEAAENFEHGRARVRTSVGWISIDRDGHRIGVAETR